MKSLPEIRVRSVNDSKMNPKGRFVLYWMTAARRTRYNFALQRALDQAEELKKPLLVLEALRCDYPWASERLHGFILDGMKDNLSEFAETPATYYPYVEQERGGGKGLLRALASRASVVVTDDFPCFFLPRMLDAAAKRLPVLLEAVDSNGLLPLRSADRCFTTAASFRRFLQKTLPSHLEALPVRDPFKGRDLPRAEGLAKNIFRQWPPAARGLLEDTEILRRLPLDHHVKRTSLRGGSAAGGQSLKRFLESRLDRYDKDGNHPDLEASSHLSPYFHFGHISAHEVFSSLAKQEKWRTDRLADKASGSRSGWWGMRPPAEAFLDELITWRELGFNMCVMRKDYDRYDSLPEWARRTLGDHARDPRPAIYSLEEFESAKTEDPLWNAAQMELIQEGRIHNYLRMLWGKKILHWSPSPKKALQIMIELNNKYALDGRDPNSYSGIFWVLGRYDRAWGPERPVFGKIRFMSSESTRRKLKLRHYLERYGGGFSPAP